MRTTPQLADIQWNINPLHRPTDVVKNFVFYLPFGALCAATTPLGTTAMIAATLSATTETAQLFAVTRVPSLRDFLVNTSGAVFGWAFAYAWRRSIRTQYLPWAMTPRSADRRS